MKTFYYLMFCAALMLAGCDKGINDDNGNGNGNGDGNGNGGDNTNTEIVLSEDTKTEVTVKADEQGDGKAIKFKAAAAWTATVKDVTQSKADTESEVEWLKLSAYSGEAGDVSLALSISKNFTGVTRKAEIIIQCGETTIKITIEQVAENADGTITKQVKTINGRWEFNSEIIDIPNGNPISEETMQYIYDTKGRVVKIISNDEDGSYYTCETIYDYSIVDEIQVTSRENNNGETTEEKYIVTLNDKGNAVKVRKFDSYENKFYDENVISYYDDGRVKQVISYGGYSPKEGRKYNFTYENGYLTKLTEIGDFEYISDFDIPTFYPNKYPNNNIVDMINFYSMYDDTNLNEESISMLSTIGRLGKTSDYFLEVNKKEQLTPDRRNPDPTLDPNAEDIIETETDIDWGDNLLSCEYDKDNNLTKVTITTPFIAYKYTYRYSVDKNNPIDDGKYTYYNWILKETNKEKIKDSKDIITYTFNYE